jgi:hypothetical protein
MIFKTSAYYLIKDKKSFQEISDLIVKNLEGNLVIEQRESPKGFFTGLAQKFTGSKQKYIYIKQNAYHGLVLRIFDYKSDIYISVEDYIPSPIVEMLWKNTGILLRPIFSLIFGKKGNLKDSVFGTIERLFEMQEEE